MSGLVNSVLILNKFLNVKVVEATFNQEKALPNRGFLFDCEPSCGPSQLYNSYNIRILIQCFQQTVHKTIYLMSGFKCGLSDNYLMT